MKANTTRPRRLRPRLAHNVYYVKNEVANAGALSVARRPLKEFCPTL